MAAVGPTTQPREIFVFLPMDDPGLISQPIPIEVFSPTVTLSWSLTPVEILAPLPILTELPMLHPLPSVAPA
eukprot:3828018-Prymnesium_polylepis.3